MIHKLIVGFPRCGSQSYTETHNVESLEDLIYDDNGIEEFKKKFPGYEPIILIRNDKLEQAFSNWTRMCKMSEEKRPFKECYNEYLKKADFEKFIEPWLKAYPDIEILKLEDLIKDPNFLHIDNFSIPHDTKNDKRLLEVKGLIS